MAQHVLFALTLWCCELRKLLSRDRRVVLLRMRRLCDEVTSQLTLGKSALSAFACYSRRWRAVCEMLAHFVLVPEIAYACTGETDVADVESTVERFLALCRALPVAGTARPLRVLDASVTVWDAFVFDRLLCACSSLAESAAAATHTLRFMYALLRRSNTWLSAFECRAVAPHHFAVTLPRRLRAIAFPVTAPESLQVDLFANVFSLLREQIERPNSLAQFGREIAMYGVHTSGGGTVQSHSMVTQALLQSRLHRVTPRFVLNWLCHTLRDLGDIASVLRKLELLVPLKSSR
ncbi:MAG: hypothetical protein MHM6MM_004897 [Cercozoa sp. M6MM]